MPKPETNIRIPLRTDEAIALIARVKPTKDMPRPGASKVKTKPTKRGKKV